MARVGPAALVFVITATITGAFFVDEQAFLHDGVRANGDGSASVNDFTDGGSDISKNRADSFAAVAKTAEDRRHLTSAKRCAVQRTKSQADKINFARRHVATKASMRKASDDQRRTKVPMRSAARARQRIGIVSQTRRVQAKTTKKVGNARHQTARPRAEAMSDEERLNMEEEDELEAEVAKTENTKGDGKAPTGALDPSLVSLVTNGASPAAGPQAGPIASTVAAGTTVVPSPVSMVATGTRQTKSTASAAYSFQPVGAPKMYGVLEPVGPTVPPPTSRMSTDEWLKSFAVHRQSVHNALAALIHAESYMSRVKGVLQASAVLAAAEVANANSTEVDKQLKKNAKRLRHLVDSGLKSIEKADAKVQETQDQAKFTTNISTAAAMDGQDAVNDAEMAHKMMISAMSNGVPSVQPRVPALGEKFVERRKKATRHAPSMVKVRSTTVSRRRFHRRVRNRVFYKETEDSASAYSGSAEAERADQDDHSSATSYEQTDDGARSEEYGRNTRR
eukprot:TRINITY_DN52024_c0_g1_i1.p1 TRINITY_DN52024_c0_g1~~TRINITY_DN52024_c0_g1_i1.p1  ORF type:complete len:521 (+),score=83.62 TRINITY_DN52024_c0_g1_i1:42-1565(+)